MKEEDIKIINIFSKTRDNHLEFIIDKRHIKHNKTTLKKFLPRSRIIPKIINKRGENIHRLAIAPNKVDHILLLLVRDQIKVQIAAEEEMMAVMNQMEARVIVKMPGILNIKLDQI